MIKKIDFLLTKCARENFLVFHTTDTEIFITLFFSNNKNQKVVQLIYVYLHHKYTLTIKFFFSIPSTIPYNDNERALDEERREFKSKTCTHNM